MPGLLSFLVLLAACRPHMTSLPPLTRRVAVLDFQVAPEIRRTPFHVKGWWFGARSVFQNQNAGEMFADALGKHLLSLEYVQQHSRRDIKYYMAGKKRLLMSRFQGLEDVDYQRMLAQVSAVDYGEELGVDHVLTGRVLEAHTVDHRTVHIWFSRVRVEVVLWDMATGQKVWRDVFSGKKWLYSQTEAMEKVAADVVRALDEKYYQVQDTPSPP